MADVAQYIPPGQGVTYRVIGGDVITFKVTGEQTDNQFTVAEVTTAPDHGPPLHMHLREEETFYVLEGSYVFHVGDRRIMAGQGSVLVVPVQVPHRFVNVGNSTGRLLVMARPSGFEHFIREFAALPVDEPVELARLREIGDRYGIVFLFNETANQ